jgi:hypothetical protein
MTLVECTCRFLGDKGSFRAMLEGQKVFPILVSGEIIKMLVQELIKSNYADVWLEVGTMSRRTVGTRCIQLKRALSRVLVYYYVALVKFLSFLLGAQKFLAIFHLLLKDKNGSW